MAYKKRDTIRHIYFYIFGSFIKCKNLIAKSKKAHVTWHGIFKIFYAE